MDATAPTPRRLTAADLDRVVAIDAEVGGRSRRGFFARRLGPAGGDGIVALGDERGGRLDGFAFAHLQDGEFGDPAPVGVLDALGVLPAARGAGVATRLLAALEAALAERGAHELRTEADWAEQTLAGFFAAAGFRVAPRIVLLRPVGDLVLGGEEFDWEELPVRSMAEEDLPAIVRLDRKITGRDRTAYYRRKADEVLRQSGVRLSLVAEVDRQFAGFLMARVDYGEFGRADPFAVLDTIGVDPAHARRRVGRALLGQLLLNLRSLRVEQLVTLVEWNHFPLLAFLARAGFAPTQRLSFAKAIGAPAR
ncbi:MAG TPA: GNAT family N-acetyltransferase [Anaeromyxobacteraceae bacterium]|jgi:GNAT superfamily N-acetyltransferase